MRKPFKVAAWAAVFLACAAVGAFVAAHTNPFPPGVDRPSQVATGSPTATATSPPAPDRWRGTFRSFTYHRLYVGGRCLTRWRGGLRFTIDGDGKVHGAGAAHLFGKLACDFPIAQVQAERVALSVTGHLRGRRLTLRIDQASVQPGDSQDFGGFVPMLPQRLVLPLKAQSASVRVTRQRVDEQGRGLYFWSTGLQLYIVVA
jgi:hypothetical protein